MYSPYTPSIELDIDLQHSNTWLKSHNFIPLIILNHESSYIMFTFMSFLWNWHYIWYLLTWFQWTSFHEYFMNMLNRKRRCDRVSSSAATTSCCCCCLRFLTHVLSYIAKVNLNWHRKAVVEVVIWFGSKRKFISWHNFYTLAQILAV